MQQLSDTNDNACSRNKYIKKQNLKLDNWI